MAMAGRAYDRFDIGRGHAEFPGSRVTRDSYRDRRVAWLARETRTNDHRLPPPPCVCVCCVWNDTTQPNTPTNTPFLLEPHPPPNDRVTVSSPCVPKLSWFHLSSFEPSREESLNLGIPGRKTNHAAIDRSIDF